MKKILLIIAILCFFTGSAQVTQIWTDYSSFWTSSSTSINSVKPNSAHNLLAFRWNGTNYSTFVDNAKLTANGVTFTGTKFRALPINSVPLTGSSSYFIGLGALVDGLPTAVDNGANSNPFVPVTTGIQKAKFLTKGTQGLDLGSCLTNIPATAVVRFNLSSSGITLSNVGDGIPDILISQIAQPTATTDKFKFVDALGATVGAEVTIVFNNNTLYPIVGNWNVDFYNNNKTQTDAAFVNTNRELRFNALDLTAFGITSLNYSQAVALIYSPGGDSDPAFLAFNEPSLGIATKLTVTAQPTTTLCNGTMPSGFTVQMQDQFGFAVKQSGIEVEASMQSGPGNLLGTLSVLTDANGIATFSNLSFEIGGDHTIRFSHSSLDSGITANISAAVGCGSNIWTGNSLVNSNWNNTDNWATATIPNANTDVEIPTGRPRYPILQNNAGAKNLTLGVNASITLNGKVFAISGTITKDVTSKIIGNTDNSVLYLSGSATQTIPSGLIANGDLANLTIENTSGVTNADVLKITQVLLVRDGNLATGSNISLVCRFTPTRRTAQIGSIGTSGSITGNVTVEQCFPARRAFRFVTSSVTTTTSIRANWQEGASAWNANPKPGYGTHITGVGASGSNPSLTDGVNGFDWQPSGASSMFTFNNTNQTWNAVSSTLGTLTAGVPYRMLIRGSRSTDIQFNASAPSNTILRSTGTILKGPVNITGLSATTDYYNLVGNPFQSIVNMSLLNSSINLKSIYYVYDPTLGGTPTVGVSGGRGAYVAVDASTGIKSNGLSSVTNFLQPYQAFYVQTRNLGTTPVLTFKESDKSTESLQTNVFKISNETGNRDDEFINLTLFTEASFNNNDTPSDGLRIGFTNNANNSVDDYDAFKFLNPDENVSRKIGETLIAMESRGNAENGDILPLNITDYKTTAYTMKLNLSQFVNQSVFLKDYYTNQNILLSNNGTSIYNFSVNDVNTASKSASRFAFAISESALSIEQPKFASTFSLFPNPANGSSIFLNSKISFKNAKVEIFNTIGQKVGYINGDFSNNNQLSITISDLVIGVYIINVTTDTGEKFSSKFIKN